MRNLYSKLVLYFALCVSIFSYTPIFAQDGITTAFAFGGGYNEVKEMRYASDGNLYFVATLLGKNQFAGNNYNHGLTGRLNWLYGKISPSGQQTTIKVIERNTSLAFYGTSPMDNVIDKDGNLISIYTSTRPNYDYGNGNTENDYGVRIVKTSKSGSTEWVKNVDVGVNKPYGSLDFPGLHLPVANNLQVMDNGEIYTTITSNNVHPTTGKYVTRIIKFNNVGDEIWHHEIQMTSETAGHFSHVK
jgi:hypothetical protein